jgi:hypothetical protein
MKKAISCLLLTVMLSLAAGLCGCEKNRIDQRYERETGPVPVKTEPVID